VIRWSPDLLIRMDDFPWHYVAMIFIVFVSWLYRRIQEIVAARRVRSAGRKAAAEAARKERPLFQESRPPLGPPPAPPSQEVPSPAPPPLPIPRSFRELFETIETLATLGTNPPAPIQSAPVPSLPVVPRETRPDPGPTPRSNVASEPEAPHPASGLTRVLRRRGSLRQALILKEILDVPASLR